jgi:Cu/Ag efflux protein CusF
MNLLLAIIFLSISFAFCLEKTVRNVVNSEVDANSWEIVEGPMNTLPNAFVDDSQNEDEASIEPETNQIPASYNETFDNENLNSATEEREESASDSKDPDANSSSEVKQETASDSEKTLSVKDDTKGTIAVKDDTKYSQFKKGDDVVNKNDDVDGKYRQVNTSHGSRPSHQIPEFRFYTFIFIGCCFLALLIGSIFLNVRRMRRISRAKNSSFSAVNRMENSAPNTSSFTHSSKNTSSTPIFEPTSPPPPYSSSQKSRFYPSLPKLSN